MVRDEDSDTYMMIFEEGQAMAAREIMLLWGDDRFGPADDAVKAHLRDITELQRLKRMAIQTLKVISWQEVLDTP